MRHLFVNYFISFFMHFLTGIRRRSLFFFTASLMWISLLSACNGTQTAPHYTFTSLDGHALESANYKGKVTLVNFWATSCVTCVAEMPKLVELHNQYKAQGYETLAVAMSYDTPSFVANFARSRQLPFNVTIDSNGSIAKAWGNVQLTPTTFLINKKGVIIKKFVGEPDFPALKKIIEKLLAESG